MINIEEKTKNGFTLVELLAVIVILAIILVIAVPKVVNVIEDAKKATLESTAKMIANAAEKQKIQNQVLGKTDEITCESVAKINNVDYVSCNIIFENNIAKVTIEGKGKFEGLSVCDGTKESVTIKNNGMCPVLATIYMQNILKDEFTLNNGLVQTEATYINANNEEITLDTGLRYLGEMSDVKNQVYYNCEDTDINDEAYGNENYDYAGSCEVWRIIGVFEVENENGVKEKRIKIINTASTFKSSWDSSETDVNDGWGINQWGESIYNDGSFYEGADLMQLLNGYYIGKSGSECKYFNRNGQKTCTRESLKSANMKVLTNTAKGMIENAIWHTYAVENPGSGSAIFSWAPTAYLQENGIIKKYTGCKNTETIECTVDNVKRVNEWIGLVGLMSVSDMTYANGWLYNQSSTSTYARSISPHAYAGSGGAVWRSDDGYARSNAAADNYGVFPSVYLKSNIKIIDGNGYDEPYKLK